MKTKIVIYSILVWIGRLITLALVLLALCYLIAFISPYITNIKSYAYLQKGLDIENASTQVVKNNVPTTINNEDYSRLISFILLIILLLLNGKIKAHFLHKYEFYLRSYRRQSRNQPELRKQSKQVRFTQNLDQQSAEHQDMVSTKKESFTKKILSTGQGQQDVKRSETDREKMIQDFMTIKTQLDMMGRKLTFLSIDVIESTEMKKGEDKVIIEYDFVNYRKFILRIFEAYNYMKDAWTPDGVIVCFLDTNEGFNAARTILTQLEDFNENVKRMHRNFVLRLGMNTGMVYMDDAVPLELISDRVIDVAGHMQKHAEPNSIYLSQPVYSVLEDHEGIEAVDSIIDGFKVYRWGLPPHV